jgi:hypothetical protein
LFSICSNNYLNFEMLVFVYNLFVCSVILDFWKTPKWSATSVMIILDIDLWRILFVLHLVFLYFLIGSSHLICCLLYISGFLELINNLLTSGMVPALYADDEKEQIIGQVTYNFNSFKKNCTRKIYWNNNIFRWWKMFPLCKIII